jgi:hypothetical protein
MAEELSFHRSLYLLEAVEAAASAYAEYAKIDLTPTGDAVTAVLSPLSDHDPRLLANAFANHVLHETIARRRQAAEES